MMTIIVFGVSDEEKERRLGDKIIELMQELGIGRFSTMIFVPSLAKLCVPAETPSPCVVLHVTNTSVGEAQVKRVADQLAGECGVRVIIEYGATVSVVPAGFPSRI